jgi:hypothetical protein
VALMARFKISGVPIVDANGLLVGILTNRDLQFERDLDRPLRDVMTSEDLVIAPVGTTLDEAERILQAIHDGGRLSLRGIFAHFSHSRSDAAITARNQRQSPRDYLGGSRIGEECARKLVYEVTHTPKDTGRDFPAGILRIFDAGHQIEALAIRWLRQAGFDLRDRNAEGTQFGFTAAGGKLRGHADGVIVAGPDIGIRWPALWESKALGQKSWTDLVKHGLRQSKPIYFAQVQLYMAYFELEVALLTAVNRDSLALHHEAVPFDAAEAQRLSDRAVDVLRAAEARVARNRGWPERVSLLLADAHHLPFADGVFDRVLMVGAVDCLREPAVATAPVSALDEATRQRLESVYERAQGNAQTSHRVSRVTVQGAEVVVETDAPGEAQRRFQTSALQG